MGIWSSFIESINVNKKEDSFTSRLHKQVGELLPEKSEESHLLISCLSGLMARIAYNDLKIDESEKAVIQNSLKAWTDLTQQECQAVAALCLGEIKELAGIENHLYCLPIREALSETKRYNIIVSLFAVAAADGSVDNSEAEEIRNINSGLLLEHKHFISAKATVLDKIGALKANQEA